MRCTFCGGRYDQVLGEIVHKPDCIFSGGGEA